MSDANGSDKVFGIDLGTTYSAIAHVDEFGTPQIIENEDGQPTTPSVVYFEDDSTFIVGQEAKNVQKLHPDDTVSLIKRSMGERLNLDFHGKVFTPESISALILRHLVETAQEIEDEESNAVVITVPAYFGTAEKQATLHAGEIAGLDVRGIIAEPVAAALSAGFKPGENTTIFVYDLGGGTMDCTVMELNDDGVEVLAVDGDRQLGGADWDNELLDLVAAKFVLETGISDDPTNDDAFYQDLLSNVEQAKISLSRRKKVHIRCEYQNQAQMIEVTREEFEDRTRDKVEETLRVVDRTIEKAKKVRPDLNIEKFILVGGSSKMPMIPAALQQRYGWELTPTEYDLAVAKGAALYGQGKMDYANQVGEEESGAVEGGFITAAGPNGAKKTRTITNVLPKSVGVKFFDNELQKHYVSHLLHANDPLPKDASTVAYTLSDDTTSLRFEIFEQLGEVESPDLEANKEISPEGGALLDNLPNLPKGSVVNLIMNVNSDGIVTLQGHEPTSNQIFELQAQVSALSTDEVQEARTLVGEMQRWE
ncbi:Hsp70 family protein [Corynebacterium mayonis]|uniref:Hsp70 family protein n=1 Tax=Corynebacterium mayonis TaxID=3062461 RepID=UPI003140ACDD